MSDARRALLVLHAEVDRAARELQARLPGPLACERGCHGCCVDGITVFDVEAERIRRAHEDLLRLDRPHPPGACAFLDSAGACRIYDDRPYVCRTQGLPLRWTEDDTAQGVVEYRDICPLNDAQPAAGSREELETRRAREIATEGLRPELLPPEHCWTLGPFEGRLAGLQGDAGRRTPLRALFRREEAGGHGAEK